MQSEIASLKDMQAFKWIRKMISKKSEYVTNFSKFFLSVDVLNVLLLLQMILLLSWQVQSVLFQMFFLLPFGYGLELLIKNSRGEISIWRL